MLSYSPFICALPHRLIIRRLHEDTATFINSGGDLRFTFGVKPLHAGVAAARAHDDKQKFIQPSKRQYHGVKSAPGKATYA